MYAIGIKICVCMAKKIDISNWIFVDFVYSIKYGDVFNLWLSYFFGLLSKCNGIYKKKVNFFFW